MATAPTLPPGVHPHDRRSPSNAPGGTSPLPQGAYQTAGTPKQGRRAFSTPNARALGVFQRASVDWSARAVRVGPTPVRIVGRRRGRVSLAIWVPTTVVIAGTVVTVTHGVLVAPSSGEAAQYAGVVLNAGDSITIASEASVYVIALPTQATGICQFLDIFNPSEGSPGT